MGPSIDRHKYFKRRSNGADHRKRLGNRASEVIDLDGGHDFIGRDALLRIREEGVKRRRVGYFLEGNPVSPGNPSRLMRGTEDVGHVSVFCHSPRLGRTIGVGLVSNDIADDETGLTVALATGDVPVRITDLPFI